MELSVWRQWESGPGWHDMIRSQFLTPQEVLLQRKTKIRITTYRGLLLTVLWHATQFILWGSITLMFSATNQLNKLNRGTTQGSLCGICGLPSDNTTKSSPSASIFLSVLSHQCSILTHLSFTDIIWSLQVLWLSIKWFVT